MNFRRLIGSSDAQEYAKLGFSIGEAKQEFQADEMGAPIHFVMPRAKSPMGHSRRFRLFGRCPLFPQERTFRGGLPMFVKCH
jgi:hypothetical protein